jgi:C_GCAxxG_C_C family probable redox protein
MGNAHHSGEAHAQRMLQKARDTARRSRERHAGCAEATFAAIAETLKLPHKHAVLPALVGMSGGIADFGTGSCGAIAGAVAAISLVYNYVPSRSDRDQSRRYQLFGVIERVAQRFKDKYGDLSCRAVQMQIFGKSFDLRNKERLQEYKSMDMSKVEVISDAAVWAVEAILDMGRAGSVLENGSCKPESD